MNHEPTIDEIEERFDSLPQDIQEAIDSEKDVKVISQIGRDYNLHFDQIQSLSASIGYLMLGFLKPQEFIYYLSREGRLPESIATQIAKEVNDKILRPIKERLHEVHNEIDRKPKNITAGDGSVSIFEQKIKHLFDHPTPKSGELRPTTRQPSSTDPYRETID
jgi:hypothetical protein